MIFALVVLMLASSSLAADSRLSFPKQFTVTQKGVNIQTGRFLASDQDLAIGPLVLRRSWGELPSFPLARGFGPASAVLNQTRSWAHNLQQGSYFQTNDSTGNLVVFVVDGAEYRFRIDVNFNAMAQNKSSQGVRVTINGNQWTLVDRQGNVFLFQSHPAISQNGASYAAQQLLMSATYANGSQTNYTYNSNAQVRTVINSLGYGLVFDYDAQSNLAIVCGFNLTTAMVNSSTTCAGAALKVSYGYEATGTRLTSVTDNDSGVVGISYVEMTPNSNVFLPSCITYRNTSNCRIAVQYGQGVLTIPDQV